MLSQDPFFLRELLKATNVPFPFANDELQPPALSQVDSAHTSGPVVSVQRHNELFMGLLCERQSFIKLYIYACL